jgi:hypothetical protein
MFLYQKTDIIMFVLIYIDEIIVTSSSDQDITDLLRDLNDDFAIKDLGIFTLFFGYSSDTSDGLMLTQEKYASELLQKVGMLQCKAVPTHLSST